MSLPSPIPNYEPFARMQNELKSTDKGIVEEIIPLLEQLMLQYLPKGARILDLGCGSGKLVQQLYLRGYQKLLSRLKFIVFYPPIITMASNQRFSWVT